MSRQPPNKRRPDPKNLPPDVTQPGVLVVRVVEATESEMRPEGWVWLSNYARSRGGSDDQSVRGLTKSPGSTNPLSSS